MIKGGYMGKVLRVDLTKGEIRDEKLPGEDVLRKYIGGTGLGAKYVMDEVPPTVKALDPENRLVFMTGPLSGTMWPGSSRHAVVTAHGDIPFSMGTAWGGGFWCASLKFAGYDGIIVQGRSAKPVYLLISHGKAQLRDASHLWGKETLDAEDIIRTETGDPRASVLSIGPVGEKCLPGALIIGDTNHATAKAGGGRVMGSKRLKAIAITGYEVGVPLADPKGFMELALEYQKILAEGGRREFRRGGWMPKYDLFSRQWRTAVKNFSDEAFQLPWAQEVVDTVAVSKLIPMPCFNCPVGCAQDIIVGRGPYKGFWSRLGGGAEHTEGIGGMVGVLDGGTVLYLCNLCNRLGVESGLLGQIMGLCYESYEKGLIDKSFADGLELKWGNADAAITLLYKYVNQEGIGKLFAQGPKAVAKAIGKGADQFLGGYKGMAHAHDVRHSWEYSVGLAVAGGGACIEGMGVPIYPEADLGWPEPQPAFDLDQVAIRVKMTQLKNRWENSIGLCTFTLLGIPGSMNHYTPKAVNLAVGWDIDRDEVLTIAERITTAMRVFNLKRGLTIADDLDVGPRNLEGFKVGPLAGHPSAPYFERMVKDYYEVIGWERETGIPTEDTLKRLGIDELIKDVRKLKRK